MPKLNVYVPADLAEDLKRLEISPSPVCQQALRREVQLMEATAVNTADVDVQAVAKRLRLSDDNDMAKAAEDAAFLGKEWAKRWATARELRNLEDTIEDWGAVVLAPSETLADMFSHYESEFDELPVVDDEGECSVAFARAALDVYDAVRQLL